jgi:hypothetical protein
MNKGVARNAGPTLLKGRDSRSRHLIVLGQLGDRHPEGRAAFSQPSSNLPIDCCHWYPARPCCRDKIVNSSENCEGKLAPDRVGFALTSPE